MQWLPGDRSGEFIILIHPTQESIGEAGAGSLAETEPDTPAQLIRKHQAGIWRYLRFLGAGPGQVDDLVQETFLAVLRGNFEQRSPGETAAYLRQVARNQFLAARRRDGRKPNTVAIEAAEAVWAEMAGENGLDDYLTALRECMTTLTDRARQALELFYTDRQSREAVARRLEMKPNGIKTLLRRARHTLRECVERKVIP